MSPQATGELLICVSAAGMRTGIWVERTEELDYSLGLRKSRANVEW